MREILFKAKRIDNGEWVEGLLWKKKYNTSKIFISCFPDKDDYEEVYVVDSNTICQYTGLTDKNGNKIWENDVVAIDHYAIKAHKVKYEYGTFCVGLNGLLCHYNMACEIIGNIFDNKDLIGE